MCSSQTWAANAVSFHISDGIDKAAVKEKIESVVSAILTEANTAYEAGREMNYSKLGIPESAQDAISSLWDNKIFSELHKAFKYKKQIRVTIDELEVMRHILNEDMYGVTLHQAYTSNGHQEGAYIFLLWDFRVEDYPQIHVCTWQPDSYKDGKETKRIPKDDVFGLGDIDI